MSGQPGVSQDNSTASGVLAEGPPFFERLSAQAIDLVPGCVCVFSADGEITFLNQTAQNFLQARFEEVKGKEWFEFVSDDQREGIKSAFLAGVQISDNFTLEFKIKTGPQILTRYRVVRDSLGRPSMVMALAMEVTDRTRAQKDEHARSEFMNKIINSASEGIVILDSQARYVLINPSGARMLNVRPDDWLGTRAGVRTHPDDRERAEEAIKRALAGEKVALEVRVHNGRDQYRLLEIVCSPISWSGQRHVLGMVSDITERKAAEDALRLSEERFRSIFEKAGVGIALADLGGRIMESNSAYQKMLGYTADEIKGRRFTEFTHPEDAGRDLKLFQELLANTRDLYQVEKRYVRKDGGLAWANTTVSLVRDDQGKPRHGIGVVEDITGRKLAEQALERSERQYRLLAENIKDVIYTTDMNMRFTYVSPSVKSLLGFTVEEAMQRKPEQFLAPESLRTVMKYFAEELDNVRRKVPPHFRNFEIEQYRKDGATVWTEESTTFIYDDAGEPIGILGISRDITDRRKSEAAMREAEARYLGLFNNSSDAVYLCDFKGNFLDMNEAALRMTGYSREDINSLSFVKLFEGEDLITISRSVAELLETGELDRMLEFKLRRKDGSHVDIQTFASLVHREGKPYCIQGIARDVTEDKALLEELKSLSGQLSVEHQKLRSMIDNMEEVVVMADGDDMIQDINPLGEKFFGKAREQLIGHSLLDFHVPELKEKVKEVLDLLKSGSREFISLQRQIFDKWLNLRVARITGRDGSYQGVILNVIDVTTLVEARKKAEEMSQAKSRFLANMSHEIRTPMNGVLGFAELLLNSPLNPKQAQYVETIMKSGEHLLNIINQILDLSRIEAGKVQMDKKVFQPELMAREALEMVRPQAEKKGLELGLSLDPGLPANLAADDRKLLQILINLAGNAIKFTESGRVEIEMGLTPGNMLSIAVRDTGPGIPADQQERVFGAFEQAEDGLNRKYQGSGLGLAISQKLAEAMGGRIELVSEPGKGSVFTVAVPVEVKVKPVAAERCVSGGRAVPASCKGLVLIIDDEADVVEVVKRMIEHLGLSAHGVLKGRRGLEWAREHRPDVILLDLNLPDLSGWEVLEALKKDPATRSIPVLMQTVMDREDLGRSRGVSAWITKPFSIETLQKALEDAGVSVAEKAERSAQSPELDRQAVKETLLVIDDNKTNRELVRELLGDGEWEVIEAASAEEGLALMKEHRPEVVLLDIALPGMDGLSAARLIRKDPDLRDAFIIAVTAAVVGAEEDKCLAAGCDAYLRKPYSINLLLEKIARRRDSGRARNRKRGTANEQMRG